MKNVFLAIGILILSSPLAIAQIERRDLFPTPNSANLGLFGQIPVDFFNGNPQINIPLFDFRSRDISIPINLLYHTASVKPTLHSSWVGFGWSLESGGVINRIMNDYHDEWIDTGPNDDPSTAKPRGYYYSYNILNDNSWSDPTVMLKDVDTSLNGLLINSRHDKAPDEFQFRFLNFSGSFFLDRDGKWKLKCKQGIDLDVKVDIGSYSIQYAFPNISPLQPLELRNVIKSFTIIGPDGTQYIFGGTPTSVEFNRLGQYPQAQVIAESWYLTKIKSISNDEVTLDYIRPGYQLVGFGSSYGNEYHAISHGGGDYAYWDPYDVEGFVLDPVYLSKITGANGYLEFSASTCNDLDYNYNHLTGGVWIAGGTPQGAKQFNTILQRYYYDLGLNTSRGLKSTWLKLDEIVLKSLNGKRIKSYSFSYLENTSNRLFLQSLQQKGINPSTNALPPFTFDYYGDKLGSVPYTTIMVDHWGYYNGVNPINTSVLPFITSGGTVYIPPSFYTEYAANRAPVEEAMKKGILTKITYPTGGFTEFEYEPHQYSKDINELSLSNSTISIHDISQNIVAGGLRIKKITSKVDANTAAITKEYLYVRDYTTNNLLSSGVLGSPEPQYLDEGTLTDGNGTTFNYKYWFSNNIYPLHNRDGNHVTYTNVTELNPDGSYTIYNYTNHDNGHIDKNPSQAITNSYYADLTQRLSNSLDVERGLLLSAITKNASKITVKEINYQYNDDPNRLNEQIRRYASRIRTLYLGDECNSQGSCVPTLRYIVNIAATLTYVHFPFNKNMVETIYSPDGQNPISTTKQFTYDSYRNIKDDKLTSSTQEEFKSTFNYSNDVLTGLDQNSQDAKNLMISNHIISIPLEKFSSRNSLYIRKERTNYFFWGDAGTNLVRPSSDEIQVGTNINEKRVEYKNFDKFGNILMEDNVGNIPTSYEWGYHSAYPTVKVVNAVNSFRQYTKRISGPETDFFIWYPGQFYMQTATFNQATTGNITISVGFGGYPGPGNVNMFMIFNLTGPQNRNGTICISNYSGGCGSLTSSQTFPNMPPGLYTISASLNSSYSLSTTGSYTFQSTTDQLQTEGIKEFYYESFESSEMGIDVPESLGKGFTGSKVYYNGVFTVPFVRPNSKNYIITYFLDGQLINSDYNTDNMQINATGKVLDEVRVYPKNAEMTTYTYDPLVGITSSCDLNSRVTYYQYDPFSRLMAIRNHERNILKRFCYNYQNQTESCQWVYYNKEISATFTKQCSPGYSGSQVVYTVPAGIYSSTISQGAADATAANDLFANGVAYANLHGTCTPICNTNNCSGIDQRCVNGVCETGLKVYSYSEYDPWYGMWYCEYHYEWSDGYYSQTYSEFNSFQCY